MGGVVFVFVLAVFAGLADNDGSVVVSESLMKNIRVILLLSAMMVAGFSGRAAAADGTESSLMDKLVGVMSDPWVLFGFAAQATFMMRFVIQWIASEKRRRSHVPVVFWYFSLAGGVMLLSYAIKRQDPVFMFGQGLGCLIYIRNLTLIYKRRFELRRHKQARSDRQPVAVEPLPDDGLTEVLEPTLSVPPARDRAHAAR